jgi:cytochrome c peroxidase
LPALMALYAHWGKVPTLRVMVAAYLGIKRDKPQTDDLGDLVAMFADNNGVIE